MCRGRANTAGPPTACVSRRLCVHGGFTLIEVLAAVALLSVGLLAVLTAGQAGRETQQRALYLSTARNIAQSKIDRARAVQYQSIDGVVPGTWTDATLPGPNSVTVTVSQFINSLGQPDPDLKKVNVTVVWPEGGTSQSLVYETLICNPN